MIKIAPSILSADFLKLGEEIASIEEAGADFIHVDVMDGHFVPNLTLGPPIIAAIKRFSQKPLDVHLMIANTESSLEAYIDAGADMITVHAEGVVHLERALNAIKSRNIKAGVALNPATHESAIKYVAEELDLVLIMSVNPGFGGQSFLRSALAKIAAVRQLLAAVNNKSCLISVDGGVNDRTARECVAAGATCLVAGSYVFSSTNYAAAIGNLRA